MLYSSINQKFCLKVLFCVRSCMDEERSTVRTEWFSAVPIKTIMDTFTEEKKSRPELVNPD